VPIYGQMAREKAVLLALSPLLGFAGHGYFSIFRRDLAELYPTEIRATGQGFDLQLWSADGSGRAVTRSARWRTRSASVGPGVDVGVFRVGVDADFSSAGYTAGVDRVAVYI